MNSGKRKIIAAVSGGVDSVVLLDMLVKQDLMPVVAHVDHGMRDDSVDDQIFVRDLASSYGLKYETTKLQLGSSAGETAARSARYAWLDEVATRHGTEVIALAHHKGDIVETIAINLFRGTGWRGVCSLESSPKRFRPLLSYDKVDLIDYAIAHQLTWHEDGTNESHKFLRNIMRSKLTTYDPEKRRELLAVHAKQLSLKADIQKVVSELITTGTDNRSLSRYMMIMIEEELAVEVFRAWLPSALLPERYKALHLLVKTARAGTRWHIDTTHFVHFTKDRLVVLPSRD